MRVSTHRFKVGLDPACLALMAGLLVCGPAALWAAPANDDFANAEAIQIVPNVKAGAVTGSNVDAGAEVGEPPHGGSDASASIWYTWTAPVDGLCTFDTFGSGFDTTLAVYGSGALDALQLLAENNNLAAGNEGSSVLQRPLAVPQSGVKLYVRAGVTYKIAVDGVAGATGNVTLRWGYQNAGVFQFTSTEYKYLETESGGVISPSVGRSINGALITVTRLFGGSGKVVVGFQTVDGTAVAGTDYITTSGTLVFEDFELSKSFIVPVLHNEDEIDDLDFSVELTNVVFHPGDVGAVATTVPPVVNPGGTNASVTLVNVDYDPEQPKDGFQNTVFSFEKAVYRTIEGVGTATIHVIRRGHAENKAVKVKYTIDSAPPTANNTVYNTFALQPGSDYATPDEDFVHISGELNWGGNDFTPKPITITITNDDLVEFNEDLVIQLHTPEDNNDSASTTISSPTGNRARTGQCTLTILYDEPPAGSLDRNHNPDNNALTSPPYLANPGANGAVYAIAVQPDNKALIAGSFTVVNALSRKYIARMNTDGSLDTTFNPGTGANGFVTCMDLDSSGRVVIGGGFTSVNGSQRYRIARLNSNGSVDTTFNPGVGADGVIWSLDVIRSTDPLEDGKILIAGEFQTFNGSARSYVARLNQDGSVDQTFNPGLGPDWVVNAVVGTPDGKVWIGGGFYTVAGNLLPGVARLNYNGTVDPAYVPGSGFDGEVFALALQNDGKLLVGGLFNQFSGVPRRCLARVNANGSIDPTFDPGTGADDVIYHVSFVPGAVPVDDVEGTDRIYIAGQFKEYNQTRRVALARLYANGTVDTSFIDTAYNQFAGLPDERATDARKYLLTVGVQGNGDVLIGGGFDMVGGGRVDAGLTQTNVVYDTETFSRAAYRPRANFARLLGGETVGPGQIRFAEASYGVDENDPTGYITLVRRNGTLGSVTAKFTTEARPPGPGAAVIDTHFDCLAITPTYDSAHAAAWMRSDGIYGPNNNTLPVNDTLDDIRVPIIPNTLVDGNRAFDMSLSVPYQADAFFLGGENIPTGFALGGDGASTEILDDDFTPGVLGFSSPTYTISEDGGSAQITVTRTNGTAGAVSVRYETLNEPPPSASTPADYAYRLQVLNFLDGQVSKTFPIPIVNDTALEQDEPIHLRLFEPTGGATVGLTNATLTIIDNDYANGRVRFTSATFATNESAGSAVITLERSGGSVGTLEVTCSTGPGPSDPAVNGVDYIGVTNTFTWANNESGIKSFNIQLLPDDLIEPDKTVSLRLSVPRVNGVSDANAQGSPSNAVFTILNDDLRGTVGFSTETFLVNENSGQALITVVRQGGSAESITVDYSATSPTPGGRFDPVSGTLTFGPGVVSRSFLVTVNDDALVNGNLAVALSLANANPAKGLGEPSSAQLTLIDNETYNEPPGNQDTTLNASTGFDNTVFALELQPDGDIVAGGAFEVVNGIARNRIARLNSDGTLDLGFGTTTGGANDAVQAMDRQSDGRILVGGSFTTFNGANRSRIARLNLDGTTDMGFDPGSGVDGTVFAVAESSVNGTRRLLAAGAFTVADGAPRARIARFLDNGELDVSFQPGAGANGAVYALAVQPDGKILVGGEFTQFNGVNRSGIARLNSDGSLDLAFTPSCDGVVRAIALQNDDRILVGGTFTQVNGAPRTRLARLFSDGSLDATFEPGTGPNGTVRTLVVQGDTRILVGGEFTMASGVTRGGLTRLNPDGSVDPTINFGYGANGFVAAILSQPNDGRIVLGGGFTEYRQATGVALHPRLWRFVQWLGQLRVHPGRVFCGREWHQRGGDGAPPERHQQLRGGRCLHHPHNGQRHRRGGRELRGRHQYARFRRGPGVPGRPGAHSRRQHHQHGPHRQPGGLESPAGGRGRHCQPALRRPHHRQ